MWKITLWFYLKTISTPFKGRARTAFFHKQEITKTIAQYRSLLDSSGFVLPYIILFCHMPLRNTQMQFIKLYFEMKSQMFYPKQTSIQ